MEMQIKHLGAEHEDTRSSVNMVGLIYSVEGRWQAAEEVFVQLVERTKRVLGAEHPDTMTSMGNLAYTWKLQGRRTDALGLIRECCILRNKILGHNHLYARNSYSALFNCQEEHALFRNQTLLSAPPYGVD
jgi:hypothetical protein